jgi:hypothetical protein
MDSISHFAILYLQHTWAKDPEFKNVTEEDIRASLVPYGEYMKYIVPAETPFEKFIHRERLLYTLHKEDLILIFRVAEDDDDESFYSNNELDDDSSEALSFIGDVRLMDDSDFREQLSANEFIGGYWDPKIHWVLSKNALRTRLGEKLSRRSPTKFK